MSTQPTTVREFLCWLDGEPDNQRVVEAVNRRSAAEVYLKIRNGRDMEGVIGDDDVYVVCVAVAETGADFGASSWVRMNRWSVRAELTFRAVPKETVTT